MLDPHGVTSVDSPIPHAYLCEQEGMARVTSVVAATDLTYIQHQPKEEASHSKRENPTCTLILVDDTGEIRVDPKTLATSFALGPGYHRSWRHPSQSFYARTLMFPHGSPPYPAYYVMSLSIASTSS
jgi:hypothetical protein